MKKDTQCIHGGGYRDPITRGLNTPIITSSSYEYLGNTRLLSGLEGLSGPRPGQGPDEGLGGMLSFELDEHKVASSQFLRRLEWIRPAVSLGGVESTICALAVTSQAKISAAERKRIGISDTLFRLSVGIEHPDDLIGDLVQALAPR